MMLKSDTVGMVRGYSEEGGCANMFELFKTVVETKGEECYAIDLGFGRFDCVTLESLRYCEEAGGVEYTDRRRASSSTTLTD